MPSAVAPEAPATGEAGQVATAPQPLAAVTHVAVIPLVTADGAMPNTFLVLEKAGDQILITQYDAATNAYYTGTDSATTANAVTATPELEWLLSALAVPGDLNQLRFFNAAGELNAPPTMQPGAAPELTAYAQPSVGEPAAPAAAVPYADPPAGGPARPPFSPVPGSFEDILTRPPGFPIDRPVPIVIPPWGPLPPNPNPSPWLPGSGGGVRPPDKPLPGSLNGITIFDRTFGPGGPNVRIIIQVGVTQLAAVSPCAVSPRPVGCAA